MTRPDQADGRLHAKQERPALEMTASRPELLVDGSDQLLRRTIQDALGFSIHLQELRAGLGQAAGLSGPAYSILVAVEHLSRKADIGINLLSDYLHLSGAFVTTEVNKLVGAGLVTKEPHPADRRRVIMTLTAQGRGLLAAVGDLQRSVNDTIFGALAPGELRALSDSLAKLVGGSQDALALLHVQARRRKTA
ncbi:transcriptional regulator, MarR family protein [Sphingomonas sp. SKA58]|nr:transcriptional regulator, MarR family protein [Sphingomonas sp. SKA58]